MTRYVPDSFSVTFARAISHVPLHVSELFIYVDKHSRMTRGFPDSLLVKFVEASRR